MDKMQSKIIDIIPESSSIIYVQRTYSEEYTNAIDKVLMKGNNNYTSVSNDKKTWWDIIPWIGKHKYFQGLDPKFNKVNKPESYFGHISHFIWSQKVKVFDAVTVEKKEIMINGVNHICYIVYCFSWNKQLINDFDSYISYKYYEYTYIVMFIIFLCLGFIFYSTYIDSLFL